MQAVTAVETPTISPQTSNLATPVTSCTPTRGWTPLPQGFRCPPQVCRWPPRVYRRPPRLTVYRPPPAARWTPIKTPPLLAFRTPRFTPRPQHRVLMEYYNSILAQKVSGAQHFQSHSFDETFQCRPTLEYGCSHIKFLSITFVYLTILDISHSMWGVNYSMNFTPRIEWQCPGRRGLINTFQLTFKCRPVVDLYDYVYFFIWSCGVS